MYFRKLYQEIGRGGLKNIVTAKECFSTAGTAFNFKFSRTMRFCGFPVNIASELLGQSSCILLKTPQRGHPCPVDAPSVDAMKKRVEQLQNVVNSHQKEIQQLNQKIAQTPRDDDTSQSEVSWTNAFGRGALKHTVTAIGRMSKAWLPYKLKYSRKMSLSVGENRVEPDVVDRQFEILQTLVKEIQELKQKLKQTSPIDDTPQSKPKLTNDTGNIMNHQLPSQGTVGFKAILSNRWRNQDADQCIAFDVMHVNNGDAYHPEQGVFTAPIPGTYAFHTTVFVVTQSTAMCGLTINGIVKKGIYVPISGKYNGCSQMIVEQLEKGDEVYVCMNDTRVIYSGGESYSTFEGFLLGPP